MQELRDMQEERRLKQDRDAWLQVSSERTHILVGERSMRTHMYYSRSHIS